MSGKDENQGDLDGCSGVAEVAQDVDIDVISQSELNAFFGESKYLQKFRAYERNGSRFAGFNIWAALFSTAWFFYRRLYAQGLMALVLAVMIPATIVLLVSSISGLDNEFSIQLTLASSVVGVRITIGYWANSELFKKARREIREIARLNLKKDLHLQMVTGAGAANIPAFLASFWIIGILDKLVWTGLI